MKTDPGSITLSRKFFESRYWREAREFSRAEAWIDLIRRAVFKATTVTIEGCRIALQRGEFCYSVRTLAEDWSWSKSKVQRFLADLVEHERLSAGHQAVDPAGQVMAQVPTIYRLVNYDLYQLGAGKGKVKAGTPSGTPSGPSKKSGYKNEGSISHEILPVEPTWADLLQQLLADPKVAAVLGDSRPTSWSACAIEIAHHFGFYWTPGRIVKALKPHVDREGAVRALRAWRGYLKNRPYQEWDRAVEEGRKVAATPVADRRFVRPEEFHDQFGHWLALVLRPGEQGAAA